jgi:CheY-like chemotaxis protein
MNGFMVLDNMDERGKENMEILIAEDDPTSRIILQAALAKWGYKVVSTSDGDAAYAALQKEDAPSLALLDWEMPGMDGASLCRKLKEQERSTPLYLILLTSRANRNDMIQGLQAGADDYIAKPYDTIELQARVEVGKRLINLQNKMLQQEKLQGVLEMAGAICHEMNQPLQSVSGFCELLLMDMDKSDPNHKFLDKIKAGIERIGNLTRKIMGITRYQSKPYLKSKIIDIDQASRYDIHKR